MKLVLSNMISVRLTLSELLTRVHVIPSGDVAIFESSPTAMNNDDDAAIALIVDVPNGDVASLHVVASVKVEFYHLIQLRYIKSSHR